MLSTENKRYIYIPQEEISNFWNHDGRVVKSGRYIFTYGIKIHVYLKYLNLYICFINLYTDVYTFIYIYLYYKYNKNIFD